MHFFLSSCTGDECPSLTSGVIQSTNHPSAYPDNDDLTFQLEVEAGSTIKFSFTAMDIEPQSTCGYDYVRVVSWGIWARFVPSPLSWLEKQEMFETQVNSDGRTEVGKYCGSDLPTEISSTGNILTVTFHSDHSVTHTGFRAEWNQVSK